MDMRVWGASLAFLMLATSAMAQQQQLERELWAIHEGFRNAKTPQELQSMRLYCHDAIAARLSPARVNLLKQALSLIDQDKLDEATRLMARVKDQEEADEKLVALTCKAAEG